MKQTKVNIILQKLGQEQLRIIFTSAYKNSTFNILTSHFPISQTIVTYIKYLQYIILHLEREKRISPRGSSEQRHRDRESEAAAQNTRREHTSHQNKSDQNSKAPDISISPSPSTAAHSRRHTQSPLQHTEWTPFTVYVEGKSEHAEANAPHTDRKTPLRHPKLHCSQPMPNHDWYFPRQQIRTATPPTQPQHHYPDEPREVSYVIYHTMTIPLRPNYTIYTIISKLKPWTYARSPPGCRFASPFRRYSTYTCTSKWQPLSII